MILKVSKKHHFLIFFLITIVILVYTPNVNASTSVNRIAGSDRYETAVAISQSGWPGGSDSAVLAYGANFPDALCAGPLANKYKCPILLTGSLILNNATAQELKRLKVNKVYIIGSHAVISQDIERQLSSLGISAVRIAGQDRYETSLKVAQEVGISKGVFVTTGLDFPDALSIAPIAAANGMPILLVPRDELTSQQKDFLTKNKIPNSYIVKGYSDISNNVVDQFPNNEVITGADPYVRNINLIQQFESSLDLDTIYVATGESFPDALAASALAQKGQNALILLRRDTIPYSAQSFIRSKLISKFSVLGGTSVISTWTEATLKDLPAQIMSVANIYDTIQEKQKYEPPKMITVTTTNGLTDEVPVTWTLTSVNTLHSGTYEFVGTIKNYSKSVYLHLTINPSVTKIDRISAEIILGSSYTFPSKVLATMSDGTYESVPVTWSSNIVPFHKAGTFTFQGKIDGLTQTASLTLKVSEDAKINFPDPNLNYVIRNKVKKKSGDSIYRSDVIDITSLNAGSSGIDDLTGLEYLINLKTLDLSYNSLTKTTALTKLTELNSLKLINTDLKDINALKGLTALTYLDISDNYIKDFLPLKNLTNLTALYLKSNQPYDPIPGYTPDYSPVRSYYDNLTRKDFKL